MEAENGNLYREKALAYKLLGPQSAPVITQRNYFRIQLWLWSGLLLAALYLLTKTQYKETMEARGVLEPSGGAQKIISPATAMVKEIYVSSGEYVEKGQILASLSTDLFDVHGSSHRQEKIRQLNANKVLLLQKFTVHKNTQSNTREWGKVVTENLRSNRIKLNKEAELLSARTSIGDRNLEAVAKLLHEGNVSVLQYDQQHVAHLDLLSRRQVLAQRIQQSEHELDAMANAEQMAEFEFEMNNLQFQEELLLIDQQIAEISRQTTLTLLAEEEGIVAELVLEQGKSVLLNQPLFYINPVEYELQATIYVPAAVHGKLSPGQAIMLRFDAFDYRIFGRYVATVSTIGQARIDPRESLLPFVSIGEPVFKITGNLQQGYVEGSDIYRLQSGMTLIADFVVSEMSLLEFIFKPILSLNGKVS